MAPVPAPSLAPPATAQPSAAKMEEPGRLEALRAEILRWEYFFLLYIFHSFKLQERTCGACKVSQTAFPLGLRQESEEEGQKEHGGEADVRREGDLESDGEERQEEMVEDARASETTLH